MPKDIYSLEIFKGIEKEIVDNIVNNCPTKEYKNGDTILIEGNDSNGEGYIIKSGEVSININGQKITELQVGDIFGEIALLNEEERTATVNAISEVKVIVLSIDNLIEMINNGNYINKTIMNRIEENLER